MGPRRRGEDPRPRRGRRARGSSKSAGPLVRVTRSEERTDIQMTANQVQGPAIHVRGLEKSYKKVEVLRGVDFDVARGSIFALLGSNGAGKTTVVNILSTLLKADAGSAVVNGFDVATQPAQVRASISLTGQFAAVDELLSG